MSIYTRQRDEGNDLSMVEKEFPKLACQVETYGSIDELTSLYWTCGH